MLLLRKRWSTNRKRSTARLEAELEELRVQNRRLTEALTVDLATGMPNGLAFEADHAQLDSWWKRTSEPYAVLRASVDGLDPVRGTPASTELFTAIAHAVRETVGPSDRAYVLEEGQLSVLLRGSTTKEAVAAAERIRARIESLAIPRPSGPDDDAGARAGSHVAITIAAIEAGFRHGQTDDVMRELDDLLQNTVEAGGASIAWPH